MLGSGECEGICSGGRNLLFQPLRSLTEKDQEAIDEKYFGLLKTWHTWTTYHDPQREGKFPFSGRVRDNTRQSSVGVAFIGILALDKGSDWMASNGPIQFWDSTKLQLAGLTG